jgi:hypothetical protein
VCGEKKFFIIKEVVNLTIRSEKYVIQRLEIYLYVPLMRNNKIDTSFKEGQKSMKYKLQADSK